MATITIYYKIENGVLSLRNDNYAGYTAFDCPNNSGDDQPNFPWKNNKNITTITIDNDIVLPKSCYGLFSGIISTNLTTINNISNLDTSNVINMKYMFQDCKALTSLDVSDFDTSKVTNMSYMFKGCQALTSLDLSNFNTSNVTDMEDMFYNCQALTSLDVSNFDTSKVINMSFMFYNCRVLTSLDVSGFDTSNVTNMAAMFSNCIALTSLDTSNFDASKATSVSSMFNNCWALTSLNLSDFDTSNVTNMYAMFKNCQALMTIIISSALFKTTQVTSSSDMFSGCTNLVGGRGTSYNSSYTDKTYAHIDEGVSNPGYFTYKGMCAEFNDTDGILRIFSSTTEYTDGETIGTKIYYTDIDKITGATTPKWYSIRNSITKVIIEDLFKPKTGYYLFSSNSLTSIEFFKYNTVTEPNIADINSYYEYNSETETYFLTEDQTIGEKTYYTKFSTFDTSNVTNMASMFQGCLVLTTLDVSNFDTSNVTNMSYMFSNCRALTSLDVSDFDTSNVINMAYMFNYCRVLTTLDVSDFDTSNVTNMSYMFSNCWALTSLDVSGFNTSNVTNMNHIFYHCLELTSLNVSNFNTSNVTDMSYMFSGCQTLTPLDVSSFDTSNVTDMSYMFSGCQTLTSLDVSSFDTSNVVNMMNMFYNCSLLDFLDLLSFDTSKVINISEMFYNCSSLTCNDIFIHINSPQTAIPLMDTDAFYGTVNTLYIDGTNSFLDQIAATCNNNNVYVCRNTEFTTDLSRMICNKNNTPDDLSDDTYEEDEEGALAFIKVNILNGIYQPNLNKFKLSNIDLIDNLSSTACNWYGSYDASTKQFSNPINFNTDATVGNIIYGVSTNEILGDEAKTLTVQIEDPFNQIFSLTDTISPRFYTIDFLAEGKEISFGYKAQADDLYEELTVQPSDWNTKWYDYYKKNENNEYVEIDDISAPLFSSGTYYKKIHDSLFKCEMDASFKNNMVSITNNQFSVGNNILTISRNGVINCSDIVISNLIGEIKMFAGSIIPTGWLVCDGTEQLIADYPLLAAVLGNTWGTPSDANHFKLPNLKGRVPIGQDTSDTDFNSLGKIDGGSKTHAHTTGNFTLQTTHMPAHTHTTSTANEYYITSSKSTANNTRVGYSPSGNRLVDGQTDTSTSSFHHRWETASVGGGSAHNHGNTGDSSNVQPYAVVNYIICAI